MPKRRQAARVTGDQDHQQVDRKEPHRYEREDRAVQDHFVADAEATEDERDRGPGEDQRHDRSDQAPRATGDPGAVRDAGALRRIPRSSVRVPAHQEEHRHDLEDQCQPLRPGLHREHVIEP
jgi:hypothetical protein